MVHIIGASSLYTACEPLFYSFRRRSPKNIYRLPGLRFCHKDSLKILILFSRGALRNKNEIVLWHDLKNTTISPQSSNNKNPWTPERLVSELDNYKNHISAVVYCREQTLMTYQQKHHCRCSFDRSSQTLTLRSKEKHTLIQKKR